MRLIPDSVRKDCGIDGATPVLVGLSGGADSVALLHALKALEQAGEAGSVAAAHLHHGIRGEAADADLAFCRALCQGMSVPFFHDRVDVPSLAAARKQSVEQAARGERYAFLNRTADACGAARIAVGHHMDDQAETVLMHLARGSGMAGLCGMPLRSGRIVRPLLGRRRTEIEAYLRERGVAWRTDETNASQEPRRNRVRHSVIPALETVNSGCVRHIAETASRLRADEALLQTLAAALLAESELDGGHDRRRLLTAPEPLRARALMRLAAIGRADVFASDVARLSALLGGRTGACIELSDGVSAWVDDRCVFIGRPEALAAFEVPFRQDGVTSTPYGSFFAERADRFCRPETPNEAYVDLSALPAALVARSRRDGDRFYPLGAPGSRKLSDCLIDRKVPRSFRGMPLLASGQEVLFVPGYTISERIRVNADTTDILHIVFLEGE